MHSDRARVFGFGLGNDCDRELVSGVSKQGRGTATFVPDQSPDLNGLVVNVL